MTTQELRDIVERMTKEKIFDIVGAVRMSSVEISRTSTGKAGFSVKVYNPDPIAAVNKAREIEQKLAEEYGFIQEAAQGQLFDAKGNEAQQGENVSDTAGESPMGGGDNDCWDE